MSDSGQKERLPIWETPEEAFESYNSFSYQNQDNGDDTFVFGNKVEQTAHIEYNFDQETDKESLETSQECLKLPLAMCSLFSNVPSLFVYVPVTFCRIHSTCDPLDYLRTSRGANDDNDADDDEEDDTLWSAIPTTGVWRQGAKTITIHPTVPGQGAGCGDDDDDGVSGQGGGDGGDDDDGGVSDQCNVVVVLILGSKSWRWCLCQLWWRWWSDDDDDDQMRIRGTWWSDEDKRPMINPGLAADCAFHLLRLIAAPAQRKVKAFSQWPCLWCWLWL